MYMSERYIGTKAYALMLFPPMTDVDELKDNSIDDECIILSF